MEETALSIKLPKNIAILRAGSAFDLDFSVSSLYGSLNTEEEHQKHQALTAIQDLVKMHMERQKDDQTTRLLFAASRGDTDRVDGFSNERCVPSRRQSSPRVQPRHH
jgi:hypothetical protein